MGKSIAIKFFKYFTVCFTVVVIGAVRRSKEEAVRV